jgi:transcriptional regulator GlxA family with amidase domain
MIFGFLVFPGLEELDLVGPWEIFSFWSKFFQGPERCLMVAQNTEPIVCAKGMSINPLLSFAECPRLDYLLVPGGEGTKEQINNDILIKFVVDQAAGCKAILSVCTGSLILHRAGLLSGKKATTHWAALDRLRALGNVEVVEERVIQDGRIWTSAGVSAGIDLALAFIATVVGEEIAGKIQFGTEYYPLTKSYNGMHKNEKASQYMKNMKKLS